MKSWTLNVYKIKNISARAVKLYTHTKCWMFYKIFATKSRYLVFSKSFNEVGCLLKWSIWTFGRVFDKVVTFCVLFFTVCFGNITNGTSNLPRFVVFLSTSYLLSNSEVCISIRKHLSINWKNLISPCRLSKNLKKLIQAQMEEFKNKVDQFSWISAYYSSWSIVSVIFPLNVSVCKIWNFSFIR